MTDKKLEKLKTLVEVLCNNVSDQPAGCDACWLYKNGNCVKEAVYEEIEAESEDEK